MSPLPQNPDEAALSNREEKSTLEIQAAASRSKDNRRVLFLALGVAAFMTIAQLTPLRGWVTNVGTWKDYIDSFGWPAHAVFAAACALAVGIGVPRLPLCAAAGLIFGFWQGALLSLLGSTAGSFGAFLLARRGARGAVLARAQRWPWLAQLLTAPSLMRVFWVRQLMLPGMVLNVMLGVTGVRRSIFIAGTLLGYLPLNIAFSLVGSGLGKKDLLHTMGQLCAALAVVNLAGWLVWRWVRRQRTIAG